MSEGLQRAIERESGRGDWGCTWPPVLTHIGSEIPPKDGWLAVTTKSVARRPPHWYGTCHCDRNPGSKVQLAEMLGGSAEFFHATGNDEASASIATLPSSCSRPDGRGQRPAADEAHGVERPIPRVGRPGQLIDGAKLVPEWHSKWPKMCHRVPETFGDRPGIAGRES
jgi:hypothetical protein